MNTRRILLYTACLSLSAYPANAYDSTSGPRYVPRDDVSSQNYTQENRIEDIADAASYKDYEQREPCQQYRKVPRNYIDTCRAKVIEERVEVIQKVAAVAPSPRPQKIVSSYTILFDFDKSNIRQSESMTLDQVTQEINKYNPAKVTVTGYTDSSGTKDYNQTLSVQREQAVSKALLSRGIANQTINREARGEYEQAVDTADGVRNQENRRVVIDFLR